MEKGEEENFRLEKKKQFCGEGKLETLPGVG